MMFILIRESLAPLLVDLVRSSAAPVDPNNITAILQKENELITYFVFMFE